MWRLNRDRQGNKSQQMAVCQNQGLKQTLLKYKKNMGYLSCLPCLLTQIQRPFRFIQSLWNIKYILRNFKTKFNGHFCLKVSAPLRGWSSIKSWKLVALMANFRSSTNCLIKYDFPLIYLNKNIASSIKIRRWRIALTELFFQNVWLKLTGQNVSGSPRKVFEKFLDLASSLSKTRIFTLF